MPGKHLALCAAAACALALGAAACGGSKAQHGSTGNLAASWHRVVLCARAHGLPTLPDPQIDSSGNAHFPANLTIPAQTRQACQAMYDRIAPSGADLPPTQAQLAGLLRFARCMRTQGVSDWPDPRADGNFPIDNRLQNLLKSAIRRPLMACEHFNPDPKGRVYSARS